VSVDLVAALAQVDDQGSMDLDTSRAVIAELQEARATIARITKLSDDLFDWDHDGIGKMNARVIRTALAGEPR
jgi:hypothetical protein